MKYSSELARARAQVVELGQRHAPQQRVLDQGLGELDRLAAEQGLQVEHVALAVASDQVAVGVVHLDRAAPDQVQGVAAFADAQHHGPGAGTRPGTRPPRMAPPFQPVERRGLGEEPFDVGQRAVHAGMVAPRPPRRRRGLDQGQEAAVDAAAPGGHGGSRSAGRPFADEPGRHRHPPLPPTRSPLDEPHRSANANSMRQLVLVRWIAVVGQLVTIALVHWGLGIALPLAPMFTRSGAGAVQPGGDAAPAPA